MFVIDIKCRIMLLYKHERVRGDKKYKGILY